MRKNTHLSDEPQISISNADFNYDTITNYVGALVVDEAIIDGLDVPTFNRVIYLPTGLQNCKRGGASHYQIPTYKFIESSKAKAQKVIDFTIKN